MEKKEHYKGLIIEHNPISTKTCNGKTVAAMLKKWDKDDLAQIYVTDQELDYSLCSNYFYISDKENLKAFFNKKNEIGKVKIEENKEVIICKTDAVHLKDTSLMDFRNNIIAICLRDLVWRKERWKNDRLLNWLKEFNPDFVFLGAGNLSSTFELALWICKTFNIPLFIHISDDYYIHNKNGNILELLHRKRMENKLEEAIEYSSGIISICDKMSNIVEDFYKKGKYFVCMNSVEMNEKYLPHQFVSKDSIKLTYTGNLGINRWKVLHEIGIALKELNDEGINAELNIYSSYQPNKKMKKSLTLLPYMSYKGSVFGDKLKQVREESDILVHVESLDKRYKKLTYSAMSTKIPEYLYTNRAILAIGPEDAASIEFLKENDIALVVTSNLKESIKNQIRFYINNNEKIDEMTMRAMKVVEDRFSKDINSEMIYNEITTVCGQWRK